MRPLACDLPLHSATFLLFCGFCHYLHVFGHIFHRFCGHLPLSPTYLVTFCLKMRSFFAFLRHFGHILLENAPVLPISAIKCAQYKPLHELAAEKKANFRPKCQTRPKKDGFRGRSLFFGAFRRKKGKFSAEMPNSSEKRRISRPECQTRPKKQHFYGRAG